MRKELAALCILVSFLTHYVTACTAVIVAIIVHAVCLCKKVSFIHNLLGEVMSVIGRLCFINAENKSADTAVRSLGITFFKTGRSLCGNVDYLCAACTVDSVNLVHIN